MDEIRRRRREEREREAEERERRRREVRERMLKEQMEQVEQQTTRTPDIKVEEKNQEEVKEEVKVEVKEEVKEEEKIAQESEKEKSEKEAKEKEEKEREEKEREEKEEKEKKEKEREEEKKTEAVTPEQSRLDELRLRNELRRKEFEEQEKRENEARKAREREREQKRLERQKLREERQKVYNEKVQSSTAEAVAQRKQEERMAMLAQLELENEMYQQGRVMASVPMPNRMLLTKDDMFDEKDKVKIDLLLDHLKSEGRLELECAHHLLKKATNLLYAEPTLLTLEAPIYIVGDIHGQFYDLLKLLDLVGGAPSEDRKFLFLGDYVDRGCFATEILFYLYSLKVNFPNSVYLLRGNHECRVITQHFNFWKECLFKYTDGIYNAFMTSFDSLPVAAVVKNLDGKLLALHAGIGPTIRSLDHIGEIMRYKEPPEKGPFCDVLWADPANEDEVEAEELSLNEIEDWHTTTFDFNQLRGCSFNFGYKALTTFLQDNDLLCLVRGHSVQRLGVHEHTYFLPCKTTIDIPRLRSKRFKPKYRKEEAEAKKKTEKSGSHLKLDLKGVASPKRSVSPMHSPGRKKQGKSEEEGESKDCPEDFVITNESFSLVPRPYPEGEENNPFLNYPPCITVFSAPNYCDKYKNFGSVMHVKDRSYEFHTLKDWQSHPYYLPNFQNALAYSITHLVDLAKAFLTAFLTAFGDEEIDDDIAQDRDVVVKKTTEIFLASAGDLQKGLKPSNVQSKYEKNLQKFEEIIDKEGINEQRPTTVDWKALNKTYSSPNLLKMFKRNDMVGRDVGTLRSRNAFHRVASVRLPRMDDMDKNKRGDLMEFARTMEKHKVQETEKHKETEKQNMKKSLGGGGSFSSNKKNSLSPNRSLKASDGFQKTFKSPRVLSSKVKKDGSSSSVSDVSEDMDKDKKGKKGFVGLFKGKKDSKDKKRAVESPKFSNPERGSGPRKDTDPEDLHSLKRNKSDTIQLRVFTEKGAVASETELGSQTPTAEPSDGGTRFFFYLERKTLFSFLFFSFFIPNYSPFPQFIQMGICFPNQHKSSSAFY